MKLVIYILNNCSNCFQPASGAWPPLLRCTEYSYFLKVGTIRPIYVKSIWIIPTFHCSIGPIPDISLLTYVCGLLIHCPVNFVLESKAGFSGGPWIQLTTFCRKDILGLLAKNGRHSSGTTLCSQPPLHTYYLVESSL